MGVLEDKLVSLQQDIIKMKSAQKMGGDNYRVFVDKSSYTTSEDGWVWIVYKSLSNFPLCQWLFTIKENGVVVKPSSFIYNLTGNSKGDYYYVYNWGLMSQMRITKPSWELYDPHNNTILAYMGIPRNSGITTAVDIMCKSNQQGIIGVEKAKFIS